MTEKTHSPEEQQPLIDRLPMDQATHLSSQERQQIWQELSNKEGVLRAELAALDAYLTDQWDTNKIAEQYPEAARKGYDFPPEATFHVPGQNVRIEGDGRVSYRALKEDRSDKNRFGDWYKLTWDRNLFRPKVQDYAKDADKLKQLIAASERAGCDVPDTVKAHFDKIQKEKEESDQAFERGKHFTGTFPRTRLEEHFSPPTAPEAMELNIRLKEDGDPTDPVNWRVNVNNEEGVILLVKKNNEHTFTLELNHEYGDSSSGESYELNGTITVDTKIIRILEGTLHEESGYADGHYEADYTFDNK